MQRPPAAIRDDGTHSALPPFSWESMSGLRIGSPVWERKKAGDEAHRAKLQISSQKGLTMGKPQGSAP